MKVALIAGGFSVEKGKGIARYSGELLSGLRKAGVEVKPICVTPPRIPYGMTIVHSLYLPYRVLKEVGDVDLVHATAPSSAFSFPFIKKPKIVTYHDLTSILCKNSGAKLHTKLSAPFIYKTVGKCCDKIIAVSTQTRDEMVTHLKIPEDKIAVINEGISEKFRLLPRKVRDYHVIGYLGALVLRKRVDWLIRTFYCLRRSHPELNVKLHICGSMDFEYPRLSKLVEEFGLDEDIEFKGSISDKYIVETYNSFDVFVLSSEWEGFGFPILEAQRCGIPVIVKEDAHIPEEVVKYCLKAESEEGMADKIYQILADVHLRKGIIEKGLNYSKEFTWDKTVDETFKVYKEAYSKK